MEKRGTVARHLIHITEELESVYKYPPNYVLYKA